MYLLGTLIRLARVLSVAALASAAAVMGSVRPASPGPAQTKTLDLSSLQAATEYAIDAPEGPGFVGSEAAVIGRALDRINQALGTSLEPDARLARLAEWIFDQVGPEPALPQQSEIDLLAHRLGLPEPLPHLLLTQAPDAPRLANVVSARLARVFNLTEYTHIGGVADRVRGGVRVVIALSRRHLSMRPVPRSLPGPARLPLEGKLAAGYTRPRFAHTFPGGETRFAELGPGPAFTVSIDLAGVGVHRLEILAEGPRGPEVIVNFPVSVGVPEDAAVAPESEPRRAAKPDQARSRLLELINRERDKAGLGALVLDPELSEVARGHSDDMRRAGFVGHVSPTAGDLEARLLRGGIVTDLAAENIGRGDDPDQIHRGLMDSPGHRAAILLPGVTHVGIGLSSAKKGSGADYIVTELFIRRIPPLPPEARLLALAELLAGRELDGLPSLKEDPKLSALADMAAREFLDDPTLGQEEVMDRLKRALEEGRAFEGRATAVFAVAGSIKEGLERMKVDAKTRAAARRVGIGIVQGTRPGLVRNAIVMILIFAEQI
ncbi:MAG TPA: CAP domain-containing protein [Acidobacteriota bacterium]|nr:CAP domain-containing protein [Acidobacteriota bacterium]